MKLIGKAPRPARPEECPNWVQEAERFGHVVIDYTFGKKQREVRISMGRWGKAQASVWGTGDSIADAAKVAVERARAISEWFPHPDDC